MSYATSYISTARDIARDAEYRIQTATGMRVTLMLCPEEANKKKPEQMMQLIAHSLNMSMDNYLQKGRHRSLVELRFLAALLLRRYYPTITLKQIGSLFGQDHTSIINALDRAHDLLDVNDLAFTTKYNKALNTINQWLEEQ